jgi:predicted MPP superfamily phosphohydrolase
MKIAWATDIRLTEIGKDLAKDLCDRIRHSGAEALLIGGDTAEAWDLEAWLRFLDENLQLPVYFVLGNHDYYGGTIVDVRRRVESIESSNLNWLPKKGVVKLTKETALIGHGGWADARDGYPLEGQIVFNDVLLIRDLRQVATHVEQGDSLGDWLNKPALAEKLQELGSEAAETMRAPLLKALESFPRVIVLTHVPSFRESEKVPEADWACPTWAAMGELLLEVVAEFPHRDVTVLCSQRFGERVVMPLPNLRMLKSRTVEAGFEILPIE